MEVVLRKGLCTHVVVSDIPTEIWVHLEAGKVRECCVNFRLFVCFCVVFFLLKRRRPIG